MFRRANYSQMTDEALMVALQKGRHRALEELYHRYQERLRYYFFRMTGQDAELARDLGQDVFVRVMEKCRSYQPGRPFRTWLFSMAHNMCKNHYRHQAVVAEAHALLSQEAQELPSAQFLGDLDAELFRDRINRTLTRVGPDHRSAFLLRHREGLSLREIADIQGCPLGTVKSRLHSVHQFLARQLADLKPEIFPENESPSH